MGFRKPQVQFPPSRLGVKHSNRARYNALLPNPGRALFYTYVPKQCIRRAWRAKG